MNKYGETVFYQYINSTKTTLADCYKIPSKEKISAYKAIISGMERVGGKHFRILSYNSYRFSCAYLYKDEGRVYLSVFTQTRMIDFDVTDTVLGTQI